MTKRNAKRSEGLHRQGNAGEKAGKPPSGFLNRRPPVRTRAGSKRKSAKLREMSNRVARSLGLGDPPVESPLSGEAQPVPQGMVARIARISSGYVVSATFLGPDFQRHEVEASSTTFPGALAELASAIASTLGAA